MRVLFTVNRQRKQLTHCQWSNVLNLRFQLVQQLLQLSKYVVFISVHINMQSSKFPVSCRISGNKPKQQQSVAPNSLLFNSFVSVVQSGHSIAAVISTLDFFLFFFSFFFTAMQSTSCFSQLHKSQSRFVNQRPFKCYQEVIFCVAQGT